MSQDVRCKLSKNVKYYRNKLGLSCEELSLQLNLDNSYISKLERGKINITLDKLDQLAVVLNISIEQLFSD